VSEAPVQNDRSAFFEDPRKDMMNRLFNYGAYLIRTNKDDEAVAWAEYAGARYQDRSGTQSEGERWQEFIFAAVNNKLVRLIRGKKIAEARTALTALQPKLNAANYRACDSMVIEAEAAELVNGIKNAGDAQKALAFIEKNSAQLPEKTLPEFRNGAVLKEGERLGKTGDWRSAMNWMTTAIGQYGANTQFNTALRTFRQNVAGTLHNQFATLFNKGDYAGAKALVQKALEEFPADQNLNRDLNMVNRALEQKR
jgi:tetratricopeptide (TPR) repeat protein